MTELCNLLPSSSLVPFIAGALPDADLLWANPHIAPKWSLQSYFVKAIARASGADSSSGRVVFADRYGGEGVGANSGSGRCGLLEDICVKGVGRTPLASQHTDYFHSYGGASLLEGMVDAIWGEVLSEALPYGASRVFALAGTGETVPLRYPRSYGPTAAPGVLILREQNLRPAHFMRACSRHASIGKQAASDTERTRQALKFWDRSRVLRHSDGACVQGLGNILHECARRSAQQIARARARRIMHGSLTPSNFDVDGRWLDFTSTTTLPDHARIIIARAAPDFMHEDKLVLRGLSDLDFYADKFGADPLRGVAPGIRCESANAFRRDLHAQLPKEFAILLGYERQLIDQLPERVVSDFYSAALQILTPGNRHPRTILSGDNDYLPVMPRISGFYRVCDVIATLAACGSPMAADSLCTDQVEDSNLRHQVVNAWWELRQAAVAIDETISQNHRRITAALASLRLCLPHWPLCRTNLITQLENFILFPRSAGTAIDKIVHYGKTNLADPPPRGEGIAVVLDEADTELNYVCRIGFTANGRPASMNHICEILSKTSLRDATTAAFKGLIGSYSRAAGAPAETV